ncbi:MAG: hypothetical protein JWL62_346 [Hyphomicrobiales bacterium]|nr:hypothetical protein [Hyphomicrobiales bacterium]
MTPTRPVSPLHSAFQEGRGRVFGNGLDRGFLVMLVLAVLGGGFVLAGRGASGGWLGLLVGLASMAIYVALPFVVVTLYCTFSALVTRWAGRQSGEEVPMRVVLTAFALTLPFVVALVVAIGRIPLVGAQLRGMFG